MKKKIENRYELHGERKKFMRERIGGAHICKQIFTYMRYYREDIDDVRAFVVNSKDITLWTAKSVYSFRVGSFEAITEYHHVFKRPDPGSYRLTRQGGELDE